MKKILCTALAFAIALCISGCNKSSDTAVKNEDSVGNSKTNTETDTVVIPNVVGMDKGEALKTLEDKGLKVKTGKIMHLKEKSSNNKEREFEKDNIVLSQNPVEGTVVISGTTCVIDYHSMENQYQYTVGEKGIVLERIERTYCPDKIFKIPKEYDEHPVIAIDSYLINDFHNLYPNIKIEVPKDIEIIGNINVEYEYY